MFQVVCFSNTNISQSSVATHLSYCFAGNLLLSPSVK